MTRDELGRRTMQGCGIMTELIKFDSHCLLPLIALGFLCSKTKPWLSRKNTFGIFLHQVIHGAEKLDTLTKMYSYIRHLQKEESDLESLFGISPVWNISVQPVLHGNFQQHFRHK